MNERHELEAARHQLELARKALVATGYFAYDEIGDDIASRIWELVAVLKKTRPLVDKGVLQEVVEAVLESQRRPTIRAWGTSASGSADAGVFSIETNSNVSTVVFCRHCQGIIMAGKCLSCNRPYDLEPDQPHIAKGE